MFIFHAVRRFFLRRQHQQALSLVAKATLRKKTAAILDLIKEDRFAGYRVQSTIGLNLLSGYPNLASITQSTKEINRVLHYKQPVSRQSFIEVRERDLDKFLTLENGYYIRPSQSVKDYLEVAREFCQHLEESDDTDYGVANHNLRMCTRLLEEHHNLSNLLLELYVRSYQ